MTDAFTAIANLIQAERGALLQHIAGQGADEAGLTEIDRHIRDGGTLATYITAWKQSRDERAREGQPTAETLDRVLSVEVPGHGTVRDYLAKLLASLWMDQADSKYGMTGNSDWRYDIYGALCRAGHVPGWEDGLGLAGADEKKADQLITAAIRHMTGGNTE